MILLIRLPRCGARSSTSSAENPRDDSFLFLLLFGLASFRLFKYFCFHFKVMACHVQLLGSLSISIIVESGRQTSTEN